jgi:MoaA/NifB/PqqE/SkfB family radical SAM enzyme
MPFTWSSLRLTKSSLLSPYLRHHLRSFRNQPFGYARLALSVMWRRSSFVYRSRGRTYFCTEPWTGIFSVQTNLDVTVCPCYLKLKIGNLNETSMQDLWNAPALVKLRRAFAKGRLPAPCRGQLCPVATGKPL